MADATPLGNGRYLVSDGGRQSVAYAAGPADARWVFLNGRVYVINTTRSETTRRGQDDDLALAAPMPAKVAAVKVSAGQQVARRCVLLTLYAMQREPPLPAPPPGRTTTVSGQPATPVPPDYSPLLLH